RVVCHTDLCGYICDAYYLCFFFDCSGHHRPLRSFPTRRSSDLAVLHAKDDVPQRLPRGRLTFVDRRIEVSPNREVGVDRYPDDRSEEHTSELQSRSDLVCRLLLEKKKTTTACVRQINSTISSAL